MHCYPGGHGSRVGHSDILNRNQGQLPWPSVKALIVKAVPEGAGARVVGHIVGSKNEIIVADAE